MTNTNAADKARNLVLEQMLKAGWLTTPDYTVLDNEGNAVQA